MMTNKGFESSCFGVEDIRLRKVVGGKQLIFVTYVIEECYYKKKKTNQNYAHISPLQNTNLPLLKLANLALG